MSAVMWRYVVDLYGVRVTIKLPVSSVMYYLFITEKLPTAFYV